MHAHDVHAYEMHVNEVHAYNVHAYEIHTREVYAYDIQFYLSNCGMGGRIARPGQRFSDAGPQTLVAALSTGNHVIPVRSL